MMHPHGLRLQQLSKALLRLHKALPNLLGGRPPERRM